MTEPIFDRPLSVELLQWLARASLRQPDILAMAIRLWAILRSLYGGTDDPLYLESLSDRFRYYEWRDLFFFDAKTEHRGDAISTLHHPQCPCTKTITDWLFDPETGMTECEWKESFERHYSQSPAEMDRILNPVAWVYNPTDKQSDELWRLRLQNRYNLSAKELKALIRIVPYPERELHKNRPFAVSRRTLKKDLKTLLELGWLETETIDRAEKYRKVDRFPGLAISDRSRANTKAPNELMGKFVKSDLADFFEKFSQPIDNIQRFYLHLEYIIPGQLYSHIEALQTQLKQFWSKTPVPPIRLSYCSAKLYQKEVDLLVYPVCICYYQRAPYLFAYGQLPQDEAQIGWYDYRLDRIQSLQEIAWDRPEIPTELKPFQKTPKSPEEVFDRMHEALGFEFYQNIQEMLVWFEPYFYDNYIQGTERACLFTQLSSQQALKWVQREASRSQLNSDRLQKITAILQSRSSEDAYYRVKYRVKDNNVIMRLRSWGPKIEVLFPLELREQMRSDLEQLWKKYSN